MCRGNTGIPFNSKFQDEIRERAEKSKIKGLEFRVLDLSDSSLDMEACFPLVDKNSLEFQNYIFEVQARPLNS